ncbi:MAG: hypothetical protein QXI12_02300 [Candidatus Methanomethyliaceae archaeon]
MLKYGLYIDYEWCSGCHSCELACRQEHGFAPNECGIMIIEVNYVRAGKKIIEYHPIFTEYCDFCAARVREGEKPACVHHCQAACMDFGEAEKMVELLKKKGKGVVYGYPQAGRR